MVAEKPSIADALAVALCEDSSQKNSSKKCGVPVHTFTGTSFRGTFPRFFFDVFVNFIDFYDEFTRRSRFKTFPRNFVDIYNHTHDRKTYQGKVYGNISERTSVLS